MFDYKAQKARGDLYRNIRAFFTGKGYLEVFTPTLSPYLIPEPTIKTFSTLFSNEFTGEREMYMIPSPEIFMKEMLASGSPSIFQISSCFRNAEQLGDVHNPEFSMLEYYTLDYDEKDSIALTEEMIKATAISEPQWLKNKSLIITMEEAMWEYAKVDLLKAQEYSHLREEAERLSLYVPDEEAWEDTFNRIFLTYVEPSLPTDREVYLTDYPKQIECLAEDYDDRPYKKRWEMYIKGIEIANCYKEETDKEKTRAYFEKEQKKLEEERYGKGETISKADPNFYTLSLPKCSGGAIGLDRLLMVEYGGEEIAPLLSFPMNALFER